MSNNRNRLLFTLISALGLSIVPVLIIAFFGNIKSIQKNKNRSNLTVVSSIFKNENALKIQGEFEFYWNQLLNPTDFENPDLSTDYIYLNFPDAWNGETINGIKIPGKGYATYRATLYFDTISPMSVRIFDYCNSYKLWINGNLVSEGGQVGKNSNESIPIKINHIGKFVSQEGANELIIQTSNFTEKFGGFRQSFIIGTSQKIEKINKTRQFIDAFVLGILFLTIIFHLVLYAFNPHYKSFLLFALLVFFLFIRQALLSNIFIFDSWINNNISLYLKTAIFSAWISSLLLLYLYNELYPSLISKRISKIYSAWIILIVILIFIAPYYWVSVGTHKFQYTIIIVLGYMVYSGIQSLIKRETQNANIVLGILFFIFFVLIEALIFNRIIYSAYTLQYGLVYFVLFESYALGYEFSKNNNRNIQLTQELEKQNKNLQKLVVEKTREVIEAKDREMLAAIVQKTKSDNLLLQLHNKLNKASLTNNIERKNIKLIINSIDQSLNNPEKEHYLLHFRKVHPDFFTALQEKFSALTQNELKLCAYLKLNLSNKEIANILHVQPESVRKSKLRLRKKMGIINEKALIAFLNSV